MLKRLKELLNLPTLIKKKDFELYRIKQELMQNKIAIAKVLENQNIDRWNLILDDLNRSEFKIFSQWGDDGIINFLINYLDIENKQFVEFGVQDYTECNTRLLLINNNWSGLIMDGSEEYMESVKREDIYWRYDLKAVSAFVTAENINQLLTEHQFEGEIGLLHIDIDGNDYWVWKAVEVVKPIIFIIEYNSIFGFSNPFTVPYNASFVRTDAHHSNLYYGTSLLSACDLSSEKGYSFIGCNSNGNNAYFVRNDKLKGLKVKTAQEGYELSKFSESRSPLGKLSYLKGNERLRYLKGLDVFNTRTNSIEKL